MNPEISISEFKIFASGLDHPEGLAFDRDGNLWAGGEAGQVYKIDPRGMVTELTTMGGFCGGFAFSPEDELFVCNAELGVVHVTRDGRWSVFADRAGTQKIVCANFPVFDRQGNLYVSDSGEWEGGNGFLLRFDLSGKGSVIGGPFGYANGLALSANERYLYMVESDTARVYEFELGSSGEVERQRVFAEPVGRVPDGLAFDRKGDLYACCYASDDIYRISLDGEMTLFAYDPNGMKLGCPTNIAFSWHEPGWLYAANLGRYDITRGKVDCEGQPLANQMVV